MTPLDPLRFVLGCVWGRRARRRATPRWLKT